MSVLLNKINNELKMKEMTETKTNDKKSCDCSSCCYCAKNLHPGLPFGAFCEPNIDMDCSGPVKGKIEELECVKEWIRNHPDWKGKPHMRYWYFCHDEKDFERFIHMHPDREHAPNDSWLDMYDIITLD